MEMFAYQFIVLPMAALVLLTFGVVVTLFRTRTAAVKNGQVSPGYFKTYVGEGEPEQARKLSRHFANLFEAPVLFYVVCLAGLATQLSFGLFQVLAWVYVLLRIAHAAIHLGRNRLQKRIMVYFISWLVLLALWILLIYRVMVMA